MLGSLIDIFLFDSYGLLLWTVTSNGMSTNWHQIHLVTITVVSWIVQTAGKGMTQLTLFDWTDINSLYGRVKWVKWRYGITAGC
jgi:hypothetical protein